MAFEIDDKQTIGTQSATGDARQLQVVVTRLEELAGGAAEALEGGARASAVRLSEAYEMLQGLRDANVPLLLLEGLIELDFEARKMAQRLLSAAVRLATLVADGLIADYVHDHPSILQLLLEGCGTPELTLHCSLLLQSCTRCTRLPMLLLEGGAAFKLLDLARHPNFDVSSDALASLHDLLLPVTTSSCLQSASAGTSTAQITAQVAIYIEANFGDLISGFHKLLEPHAGYVVQRQALRLLRKVLHRHSYAQVMQKYVADARFLQIHMKLMLDQSRVIQCEAFCIFKLFVINSKQPSRVQRILWKNSERIVRLLNECQCASTAESGYSFSSEDIEQVVSALRRPPAQPQPVLQKMPAFSESSAVGQQDDLLDSLVKAVLQGFSVAEQPAEPCKVICRTPQDMEDQIGEALHELWRGPPELSKGVTNKASWDSVGGLQQLDIAWRILLDLFLTQFTFGMPFLRVCLQQLLSHLTGQRMLQALPLGKRRLR